MPRLPDHRWAATNADVAFVRTEKVTITIDEARELVSTAGNRPSSGRWRDHRGGRGPDGRAHHQRAAQGHRGTHAPHRLDAVRALPRRRAGHHPLALPPGGAAASAGRRRRGPAGQARRRRPGWPARRPGLRKATSASPAAWPPTPTRAIDATRLSGCRCGCAAWPMPSPPPANWWTSPMPTPRPPPNSATKPSAKPC